MIARTRSGQRQTPQEQQNCVTPMGIYGGWVACATCLQDGAECPRNDGTTHPSRLPASGETGRVRAGGACGDDGGNVGKDG